MDPKSSRSIQWLPVDHINALIRDENDDGESGAFSWKKVEKRLNSKQGKLEAREFVHGFKTGIDGPYDEDEENDGVRWGIGTTYEGDDHPRTFLHVLCGLGYVDSEFDGIEGSPLDEYNEDDSYPHLRPRVHPGLPEAIAHKAVHASEDICELPDGYGYLPIHVLLDQGCLWTECRKSMFMTLYNAAPASLRWVTPRNNSTALHLILSSHPDSLGRNEAQDEKHLRIKKEIILFVVDKCPELCSIQDIEGCLPLHQAAKCFPDPDVIAGIAHQNPLAPRVLSSEDGDLTTPLHLLCTNWLDDRFPLQKRLRSIRSFIELPLPNYCLKYKCPSKELYYQEVGDVFDHICQGYTDVCEEHWTKLGLQHSIIQGHYKVSDEHDNVLDNASLPLVPIWQELLDILDKIQDPSSCTFLHSLLIGETFRPWHYLPFLGVSRAHHDALFTPDRDGNLPLHLLLTNYFTLGAMRPRSAEVPPYRAVQDANNYDTLVTTILDCLMYGDNIGACKVRNGSGDYPLHLALKAGLPYDTVIERLVKANGDALMVRGSLDDPRDHTIQNMSKAKSSGSGLYPFALAAVGPSAKTNTVFTLLKTQPGVMNCLLKSTTAENSAATKRTKPASSPAASHRKRKASGALHYPTTI